MKIKLELRKEDNTWYFNTPTAPDATSREIDRYCTGGFWLYADELDPRIAEFLAEQAGSAIIPVILDIPGIPG